MFKYLWWKFKDFLKFVVDSPDNRWHWDDIALPIMVAVMMVYCLTEGSKVSWVFFWLLYSPTMLVMLVRPWRRIRNKKKTDEAR